MHMLVDSHRARFLSPYQRRAIRAVACGVVVGVFGLAACSGDRPGPADRAGATSVVGAAAETAAVVQPEPAAEVDATAVEVVPDFELTSLKGELWRLADQGDRPKLLMFWATWCPFCKKIFPTIQEIHETYGPELVVAAISIRDKGDVQGYVNERGLTMDILLDGDDVGTAYEVPGTPAILLLDGNNEVFFGTLDSNPEDPTLRNAVDALLAERAAASS